MSRRYYRQYGAVTDPSLASRNGVNLMDKEIIRNQAENDKKNIEFNKVYNICATYSLSFFNCHFFVVRWLDSEIELLPNLGITDH